MSLSRCGHKLDNIQSRPFSFKQLDATSRYVLAWAISFEAPSYRSCMAVIQDCVRRHNRVPDAIVADSGAEFDSIYYEVLLATLRVTKVTRAKSKPRFGSILERWFGVNNQQFIHELRGNNQALQNPRAMSPSHDPRLRAEWNLTSFTERFEKYIHQVYHQIEHPALDVTPQVALTLGIQRSGERLNRRFTFDENFKMLCMPSTARGKAKVIAGRGVKINYLYYSAPALRAPLLRGTLVEVRYDPMNIARAYAYVDGRWETILSEYRAEFEGHSVQEIEMVSKEMRAQSAKSYGRAKITAKTIARFMQTVGADEASMIQRHKDEEWHKANQAEQDALIPAHFKIATPSSQAVNPPKTRGRPRNAAIPDTSKLAWKDVPVHSYGEM